MNEEVKGSDLLRELAVAQRRIRDLEHAVDARDQQLDPESVKHWDAMRFERDGLRHRLAETLILCDRLADCLIWCSGSPDFAKDGVEEQGWLKGPAPALEEYRKLTRQRYVLR